MSIGGGSSGEILLATLKEISSIMSPLNPRHLVHLHLILPSVWSELKRTTFGLGSTLFVL